jgi:hypothetical protein
MIEAGNEMIEAGPVSDIEAMLNIALDQWALDVESGQLPIEEFKRRDRVIGDALVDLKWNAVIELEKEDTNR